MRVHISVQISWHPTICLSYYYYSINYSICQTIFKNSYIKYKSFGAYLTFYVKWYIIILVTLLLHLWKGKLSEVQTSEQYKEDFVMKKRAIFTYFLNSYILGMAIGCFLRIAISQRKYGIWNNMFNSIYWMDTSHFLLSRLIKVMNVSSKYRTQYFNYCVLYRLLRILDLRKRKSCKKNAFPWGIV